MTGRNRNNSLLSLLGGAAAGAIAMYLLDPDQGERRREQLGGTAGDALKQTGEKLGTAWDSVSEQAKHVAAALATGAAVTGERVSDAARDFSRSDSVRHAQHAVGDAGHYVGSIGHDLLERVRGLGQRLSVGAGGLGSSLSDSAHGAADRAREATSSARSSVGSWISGEEEDDSHLTAQLVTAAAALALGGAAMYFLDPKQGRTRRAWAGGKVHKIVNDTGRTFQRAGAACNDMLNRTRGTAHELQRSVATEGPVSAEQLLQRVRSQMGHVVSRADQIQVMTDAQGHVELSGKVAASELDGLLTCVRRVGGVNQVTNRLEILDRVDQASGEGSSINSPIPQL